MNKIGYRAALTAMALGLASAVAVAGPGDGRFTMSQVDDGFVRLDKQTGAMALCTKKDADWSCVPMADQQRDLREDLDRLKAENEELKKEIRRLEDTFVTGKLNERPGTNNDGPPGGMPEFKLPSEEDVDQAVDYLERMIRKFRDRFEDFGDKTDPNQRPRNRDDRFESDRDSRGTTPL